MHVPLGFVSFPLLLFHGDSLQTSEVIRAF